MLVENSKTQKKTFSDDLSKKFSSLGMKIVFEASKIKTKYHIIYIRCETLL